jgi:hypothetical protein
MMENKVMEKINDKVVDMGTGEIIDAEPAQEVMLVDRSEVITGVTVENLFNEDKGTQLLTSMKLESPFDKMKLYNAIQQDSKSLKDAANIEFILEHFVAHNIQYLEEDGSYTDGVRIVLIDDKGNTYSGSGVGIRNSLQKIFAIFGRPDTWHDFKLKVKPVLRKVGNEGQSTVVLEVVDVIKNKA